MALGFSHRQNCDEYCTLEDINEGFVYYIIDDLNQF